MNVFSFEFRRTWRSFLTGTLTQAVVAFLFLYGMFPLYHDARSEVGEVLAGFPPQLAAAFGLSSDIFSFGGFFGLSYLWLSIVSSIFGALWGLRILGREKTDHCEDFLLSKTVSRASVFWQKLAAAFVGILVMNAVFLGVVFAVRQAVAADSDGTRILLATLSVGGVQIVFAAVGAVVAVFARHLRSVSGLAAGMGILGFVLSALPQLADEDTLKIISPFSWFDVHRVATEGGFDTPYIIEAACVVVVCIAVSFIGYVRRDIKA